MRAPAVAILLIAAVAVASAAAPVPVTSHELERVDRSVVEDGQYDLESVARLLPRIFATRAAQDAFFRGLTLDDQDSVQRVHLAHLIYHLGQHGLRAAQKNDWSRAARAYALIVEVCFLPTGLTPPARVTIAKDAKGRPVRVPGASGYVYCSGLIGGGVDDLRRSLRSVAALSPEHAACLDQVMTRIQGMWESQRNYARQRLAIMDAEPGTPPRLIEIYKADLVAMRGELPRLRAEIAASMICMRTLPPVTMPPDTSPHPPAAAAPPGLEPLEMPVYGVEAVAFSPDGRWLISGRCGKLTASGDDDKKVHLWDAQTGELKWSLTAHRYAVFALAVSPDGRQSVTGSGDHSVKLWDMRTHRLRQTLGTHEYCVNAVAFSADGRRIASVGSDTVKLWDARTGRLQRTISGRSEWAEKGRSVWLEAVAFSPDGKWLAGGSHDHTVKLWGAKTGKLARTLNGHQAWVNAVAFSPAGHRLASGSSDGTVKLWEVETGRLLWTTARGDRIESVAFSPDGAMLAAGGGEDKHPGFVKVWDAQSGELRLTLTGHEAAVNAVAFSPDGKRIATGSEDKTVKLWDARTGELQRTLMIPTSMPAAGALPLK